MHKAALISIRPKYTGMIFAKNRKERKSLEIRKTSPLLPTPFKCYVYETGNGVIGEFTCTGIERISRIIFMGCSRKPPFYPVDDVFLSRCCLSYQELEDYMQGRVIHAWRVDNPVKYDTPKELSEFRRPCENDMWCESCAMFSEAREYCGNAAKQIIRPPQSWCYVEDVEE